MSILRRLRTIGTLALLMAATLAAGSGLSAKPATAEPQSSVLVDLSGANITSRASTASSPEIAAPIVDASSKKKKPAPSFWNKLMHPTQWFSGSKKK